MLIFGSNGRRVHVAANRGITTNNVLSGLRYVVTYLGCISQVRSKGRQICTVRVPASQLLRSMMSCKLASGGLEDDCYFQVSFLFFFFWLAGWVQPSLSKPLLTS